MELKKGQTIMVDANLQQPSSALHEDVSKRSGLPADTFELYHGSKRLEGEAVLGSWGVEKDSLIEVKTRGRGGMRGGGGSEGGVDGGGGVGGGGGGTNNCRGGIGGVGGVGSGSGSNSGVGGGGIGVIDSNRGVGGADNGLGVAGGGVGGGGDAEGRNAGQERTRNQDGKRPQIPKGKPPSPPKAHGEKQLLQNAKAAAQLKPEADCNALDDITANARSGVDMQAEVQAEVQAEISKGATLSLLPSRIIGGVEGSPKEQETHRDSTVGGEPSSIKAIQISSTRCPLALHTRTTRQVDVPRTRGQPVQHCALSVH